ncbi:MAG: GtrA family protein [Chloroflexi bacterium]|nr:MAG: GtrA family protein [Chloroflexota bacterium]
MSHPTDEVSPLIARLAAITPLNPKEAERFVKFAIVGAFGAVVDFTVLNIMKLIFEAAGLGVGWQVSLPPHQIQLIAANAISFSTAVLSNFTWNRLWTFPESRAKPIGPQLAQFATVNVLGLVINTILLVTMDHYVFQHFVGERLSYNLAKAFAIGVVLFWNFGINRIWTYRDIK